MGDGIDPELMSGIISSILAFLLLWLKSSMDNRMGEVKEVLSNINTNLNNININLISQSQRQNVVVTQGQPFRPHERIIEEKEPITVEEENIEEKEPITVEEEKYE